MNIDTLLHKSLVEYIPDAQLASDGTYRCRCPIHHGDNPTSFVIFPDSNTYYCFSCGSRGNIINYVMERDSVTFDYAVHQLCDDFGITLDDSEEYHQQVDIVKRNAAWAKSMQKRLPTIVDYLHKRGITDESIKTFGLGYSDKLSALSIPMQDEWGRTVAFLYRFFDRMPKYKNSKNIDGLFVKGEFLFGLPQAQKFLRKTKTLMLCEGALDAISAIQQENCCVAYCGISVGKSHIEKIKDIVTPMKAKVVLCPDNDGKASKFVLRARDLFRRQAPNIVVKVAIIPDGCKDFNDMVVEGKDIAKDCTYESIDLYCVKQMVDSESDRDVQEKNIMEFMNTVRNPMVRADIAEYLAKAWNRDISLVRELLNVKTDTAEEKMQDVVSIDTAYMKLQNKQEEEKFGTGLTNIDETIRFAEKDVVVLGAYSFSGKCLAEGSMVRTNKGFKAIEDITQNDVLLTINENTGKLEWDKPLELQNTGIKRGFKVTTRTGKSVIVSASHPFLTPNGWIKVKDGLASGMQIALPRFMPINSDVNISERDTVFLALMIADGCCTNGNIRYSKKNESMRDLFREICKSFGSYAIEDKNSYDMMLHNAKEHGARQVLERYGVMWHHSYDKIIPQEIMNASNDIKRIFLGVLWSGDGSMYGANMVYDTVCEELARQVQTLLHDIGIIASIRSKVPKYNGKEHRRVYSVNIPRNFQEKFVSQVRIIKDYEFTPEKSSKRHEHFGRIRLNEENAALVLDYYKGNHKRLNEILGRFYNPKTRCGLIQRRHFVEVGMTKGDMLTVYNDCHVDALRYAVMPDVFYDDIVSIEDVGDVQMYDIAMSVNHNFVANSIIVHNTDMLTEWILHWCIVEDKKVLFFSMEMPVEDIMKVIVAKVVQVPRHTVLQYIKDHPETYNLITDKLRKNLFIIDKNSLTFENMEDYVRLMQNKDIPIDIVAVDYFQYMKNVSTIEEQDVTARQMKAFAKKMGVTLVMLSQLRKASQSKEGNGNFHEPTQADLMGSGAIGNSADYIILIWRPALNAGLSPIEREEQKYDTVLKITKAREVRNANTIFKLEYDPATSRLHEKL